MLRKIETPEHAILGLDAVLLLRRYRASQQQHAPFKHYVSNCLFVVGACAVLQHILCMMGQYDCNLMGG